MPSEKPTAGTNESEILARRIADVALERKAQDVVILDVRRRSSYTDFLVIASGTSDRHVQAVAELVVDTMKKEGAKAVGNEGIRGGQWALIDFSNVVVHVFHQFTRDIYNLEELWADAPRTRIEPTPSPIVPASASADARDRKASESFGEPPVRLLGNPDE